MSLRLTHRRTHSWRGGVFLLLAIVAFGFSLRGAPDRVDPIVGNWSWQRGDVVTFRADGTAHNAEGLEATWQFLQNSEVQRHYRIIWDHGRIVHELSCAEDGQSAHVRKEGGATFEAHREPSEKAAAAPAVVPATAALRPPAEATDPIVGEWQWIKSDTVTFQADGTMTNSNGMKGVWMFLRNPEVDRKYVLDWKFGVYTDHLTYNRTTRTGRFVNQIGDRFDVTQGAKDATATPNKPADYFGAPGR